MADSTSTTSLKDVFGFPFRGPGWQGRFAVGAGLVLAGYVVPLVPLVFVYGYALEVMRRVAAGEAPEMPAWDDWGQLGLDGLRAMLAGLGYLLPGLLVYLGGMGIYFAGTFGLPFLAESSGDAGALFLLAFPALMAALFVAMALGGLLLILGAIPLPVALAHVAAKKDLGAAFRVRQWWAILQANRMGFFIAWVIVAGLGAILYTAVMLLYYSVVLCGLLPFVVAPAAFYLQLVGAAVFAQSYREGAEALAEVA